MLNAEFREAREMLFKVKERLKDEATRTQIDKWTTSGQQVDNKGPKQPQTNLQIVFRHWDGTGMPLVPRYKAQLDAEAKKLCEKYNVSAKSSQVSRNCSLNSFKHLKAFQRLTPR